LKELKGRGRQIGSGFGVGKEKILKSYGGLGIQRKSSPWSTTRGLMREGNSTGELVGSKKGLKDEAKEEVFGLDFGDGEYKVQYLVVQLC